MCVLRVVGRELDAAGYLATSKLTAYKVFRAGEPRFLSNPGRGRHAVSGFSVAVSDPSGKDLRGQVEDAVAFLAQHEDELLTLRSTPGVEDVRLDFPVDLRIDRRNVMAQFEYLPPELIRRAGALGMGIELSIYPEDLDRLAAGQRPPSH